MKRHRITAALGFWLALAADPATATEGGPSLKLHCAYNDCTAGTFQALGVYTRNDVAYHDASTGLRSLGGRVALDSRQRIWVNLTKLGFQAECGPFGARYGAAATDDWSRQVSDDGSPRRLPRQRRWHQPRGAVNTANRVPRRQPDRQMDPRYRHAELLRRRPRDGVLRVLLLMSRRTAGKPHR